MPRAKTASFVTELEIIANSKSRKELEARYNAGFRLLNAVLDEFKQRLALLRNSKEWKAAKRIPHKVISEKTDELVKNPERSQAFQVAKSQYRFTKQDAEQFAAVVAKQSGWIRAKLDSVVIQTLAERAFKAVEKILFGKARKIRFKNNSSFASMQGKQITTSIRVKQNPGTQNYEFVWGKLVCPLKIDWTDPCIVHGMTSTWKYGRIVRRTIRGKVRYFVQLICEGLPYAGRTATQFKQAQCCIDLNVSTVAMVAHDAAFLEPFAPQAPKIDQQVKALQQRQERSRRQNNPNNYATDDTVQKGKQGGRIVNRKGQIKRGQKLEWNHSKTYTKLGEKRRRLERSKTQYVQGELRRLANKTLREGGVHLKLENVSVKGWQKRYGKAIALKSPGYFQSELMRKAESAGGSVQRFATQATACSQTHLNGERHRKSLSERVHYDVTGIVMQRDLFSAYLGLHVNQDGLLMVDDARADYPRIEPILTAAWQASVNNRTGRLAQPSEVPDSSAEIVCVEGEHSSQIAVSKGTGRQARREWSSKRRLRFA